MEIHRFLHVRKLLEKPPVFGGIYRVRARLLGLYYGSQFKLIAGPNGKRFRFGSLD